MKTLIAAIGALALASAAAQAEPMRHEPAGGPAAAQTAARADHGGAVAVATRTDDRGQAWPVRERATNTGAGTSRSSNANQG